MPLSALPRAVRAPVAVILGLLAVALAGVSVSAWVDSRAHAAAAPLGEAMKEIRSDLKAIRSDAAQTREDVAYLRGRLE